MKKIFILISLLAIFSISSYAQGAKAIKAVKYFDVYDYYKTIQKLEPLTDKTPEMIRLLAISYFNTGQYDKAEQYFAQLANAENPNPDDIYNYVKVLLINKKYDEAEKMMERFRQLVPNDHRAILFASNKGFYKELLKDKGYFTIKNLDFNSDAEDFAPAFYKENKIVFSSSRQWGKFIIRRWTWNKLPFLDFYEAQIDTNLEFRSIKRFKFNRKYHEGTISFNKKGDFLVYTANNYQQKSSDGVYKLAMYSSKYVDGKWQKPKPFDYNNPEYSVGHPALTPDGKTMYFASDMPGGIGGVDLYVTHLQDDGTWSKPQNLGPEINTEGNEMFPFIHKDGYLFFASDGRPGLGGLDIFVAKVDGDHFTNVQNLGAPVNSNYDDFAFILSEDMKYGYFSSNRPEGKGNDDIYSFILHEPFFIIKLIAGVAMDDKSNLLADVQVSLFDDQGNLIKSVPTDSVGKFSFSVDPNKTYVIVGEKLGYVQDTVTVSTTEDKNVYQVTLVLKKIPQIYIVGTVIDRDTKEPLDSVLVKIEDSTNFQLLTDTSGKFVLQLKNVDYNDTVSYKFLLKKQGYLPLEQQIELVVDHDGNYEYTFELPKLKIGEDIARLINLKPIYFDFNKADIRPDAAAELDKIVKIMNEYPTMVIELGSHTDSRGSYTYNLRLSQRRAKSSAEYIKQRIVNPNRIIAKGYGESKPLVVTEEIHEKYKFLPVGQELNDAFIRTLPKEQQEIAHQLNRRTEFRIIKY